MRAALLTEYEEDFVIDTIPDPTITSPTDVIVRVGAAGFCRSDIHIWHGHYDALQKGAGIDLPFVCGHENAGWVVEVGSAVTHVAVGDTVLLHLSPSCGYCKACRAGDDMHCVAGMFTGVLSPGGFAEYVKTSARAVVPIPSSMAPADAAPLADAGLAAYHAVRKALPHAVPGTRTVVLGAGGLGHIAIQALRALSQTEIIVVDRNAAALDRAHGWGADHTVLSQKDRSHIAEIMELTHGAGAEVVLDYVGEGGAQKDGVEVLATNGVDFLVGSGAKLEIDILSQMLIPERSFVGNSGGTYNELVELVALAHRGVIEISTTRFPLEGVNEALHALNDGKLIGRGVLMVSEG